MLKRFLPCAAVLCLAVLPAAAQQAAPKPAKPTLVVRLQSIDGLIDTAKYLANLAGREEDARQLEGFLQAMTGNKGLEGVDTKRPLGAYAFLGGQVVDSSGVLMVPIADQKAFLALLERLNFPAEEDEGGVYVVRPENFQVPVYFRFANQYAYATFQDRGPIDPGKLLPPNQVFQEKEANVASVRVNIEQVPDKVKEFVLPELERRVEEAKQQRDEGETEAQHRFKGQLLDSIYGNVSSLIQHGGELQFQVDVDRQAGVLAAELSLTARPGTELAKKLAELGQTRSVFAGLRTKDAALNFLLHASLPEEVRKNLGPVIDEGIQQGLTREADPAKREQAKKLLKALEPSLKAGVLDSGLSLRGPSPQGQYTLVAGLKVEDGKQLDQTVRDLLKDAPAEDRAKIQLDAEKAGGISIHRIDAQKDFDQDARQTFGDNPIYFAFRPDALLLAAGPDGLSALKEGLTLQPKAAPTLELEVSMARLAPAMARQQQAAPQAAQKAFKGGKEDDTIRVIIEGGQALKMRFSMQAPVITFFSELEKAEQGE